MGGPFSCPRNSWNLCHYSDVYIATTHVTEKGRFDSCEDIYAC